MKKRLLVLSDSLALARSVPEESTYENTWPALLQKHFNVHQLSIGGGRIGDILSQASYHVSFNPDIVVLQCGIVDCAPRSLGYAELKILKLPPFRKIILPFFMKNAKAIRKIRNMTYTPPKRFEKEIKAVKALFEHSEIYAIGILPASKNYEKKVPGIIKKSVEYNLILSNVFSTFFISMDNIPDNSIMSDNIHLNEAGQLYIYDQIMKHVG
ncbi:MAG: SGNH/GDSL hydrolase family protein [Bacteroidota bacterium]